MKHKLTLPALALSLLLVTLPALAHHGSAVYDKKAVTLTGTVAQFEFSNPHILIYVDVKSSDSNAMQHWILEYAPPSLAMHDGWSKDMMKPGDQIVYEVHPARNGAFLGRGSSRVIVNGKELGTGPAF